MKYAFSNLACPDWSVEHAAREGARLGYSALELRLLDGRVIDPVTDAERVRLEADVCREQGLDLCAFDSSCVFNVPVADMRSRQVADLRAWIRLAGQLEVRLVRVFGGANRKGDIASEEEATERVVDCLRRAAPDAEHAGVIVALETHDAFSSASRVLEVLEGVASPSVAALWDVHHPYRTGQSIDEVIELLGPRIAHVHIKDARRSADDDSGWELVPMGEGEVPVEDALNALRRYGYAGYTSVEWEKKWHPELADPDVSLPQHIGWLRNHTPGVRG